MTPKLTDAGFGAFFAAVVMFIGLVIKQFFANPSQRNDRRKSDESAAQTFREDILKELHRVKEAQRLQESEWRRTLYLQERETLRWRYYSFDLLDWCAQMRITHMDLRHEFDVIKRDMGQDPIKWSDLPPIPNLKDSNTYELEQQQPQTARAIPTPNLSQPECPPAKPTQTEVKVTVTDAVDALVNTLTQQKEE